MSGFDPRKMADAYVDEEVTAAVAEGRELWRPIVGVDRRYEISSAGRVRSCDRQVDRPMSGGGPMFLKGKLLRPGDRKGTWYPMVVLADRKSVYVHRLVATAFLIRPEGEKNYEVNHKNGVKLDNRVENLEWVTRKQNALHATRVLGCQYGEKHWKHQLSDDDVVECRVLNSFGASHIDLARAYGVTTGSMKQIIRGINRVMRPMLTSL